MLRAWIDAVRRNHALEHATVTVLLARTGPTRLAGRASGDGFFILSDVDEATLDACAREALDRLQRGEAGLAISPMCGTNIAVTGALTAASAMAVLSNSAAESRLRDRFGNAFTAAMIGVVLAQPVGRMVQKYLTTRPDLDDIQLIGTKTVFRGLKKVYTRTT